MKPIVALLSLPIMATGAAAPPPPVPPPAALNRSFDGYDMRQPYQIWHWWVERQKGPVTEALLSEPHTIDGLKPFGLLLRYTRHNDYGHYLTGEIRGYCEPDQSSGFDPKPGTCRYIMRRAYVPLDSASYKVDNPLSEWSRANFNASGLARHFRDMGLGPRTDWWMADWEKMFAKAPSPDAVLRENAVIARLDSVECPAMGQLIEALEGQPIPATVDLATVGSDDKLLPPAPHANIMMFKLYLRADGDAYSLEGSGGPLAKMASPILEAANACEKAGKGRK